MRQIALRPAGRVSILVISVVAAAGLLAAATWWYMVDRQRYAVAVPPPTAAPEQVVLAYLHALDAHDSATAEALTTADHQSTTGMWLRTTARIAAIRITGAWLDTHYGQYSQTAFRQALRGPHPLHVCQPLVGLGRPAHSGR